MLLDNILVETGQRVATVTLDRASTGNLIDERMAVELAEAFGRLDRDEDVWVVVLAAKGDTFCRGTDPGALGAFGGLVEALCSLRVSGPVAALQKPVIAAINGDALGQGMELAMACDIRISSSGARFGLTQVEDGMMPWDGGTQRLPRLVGRGRALEMILNSRRVAAQEALDMGLISQVVEPGIVLERSQELAAIVAGHGPIAARYLKEAVVKGLDMTLEQGLRLEADLNLILQSTSDRAEGIRSFLDRRDPEYRGE